MSLSDDVHSYTYCCRGLQMNLELGLTCGFGFLFELPRGGMRVRVGCWVQGELLAACDVGVLPAEFCWVEKPGSGGMQMCHADPRPDGLEVVAPQVGHRGSLDRVHLACGECGPFC
jgi:hypothetical protein